MINGAMKAWPCC